MKIDTFLQLSNWNAWQRGRKGVLGICWGWLIIDIQPHMRIASAVSFMRKLKRIGIISLGPITTTLQYYHWYTVIIAIFSTELLSLEMQLVMVWLHRRAPAYSHWDEVSKKSIIELRKKVELDRNKLFQLFSTHTGTPFFFLAFQLQFPKRANFPHGLPAPGSPGILWMSGECIILKIPS